MRLVKQGKTKKHVAILLVLAMLLTIMPMSVFAEGDGNVVTTAAMYDAEGSVVTTLFQSTEPQSLEARLTTGSTYLTTVYVTWNTDKTGIEPEVVMYEDGKYSSRRDVTVDANMTEVTATFTGEEVGEVIVSCAVSAPETLYVAPEGTGNGSTAEGATTLEKAVELLNNNAAGGEIIFTAGTYEIEKIYVESPIIFDGQDVATVIVKAEVNRNNTGKTHGFEINQAIEGTVRFENLDIQAETEETYGVLQLIWIHNTDSAGVNVEIDNCNLTNIGAGNPYRHAVSMEYASGSKKYYFNLSMTNSVITARSYGFGSGLNNGNPDVSDSTLNVQNCKFNNVGGNGSIYNLHLPMPFGDLNVENNTFNTVRSGGIKYIYSSVNNVVIRNNNFSDINQERLGGVYAIMATTQQKDYTDARAYSYATELSNNILTDQNTIIAVASPVEAIWFPDGQAGNNTILNNYGNLNITDQGTRYGKSNYGGWKGFIVLTDFGIVDDVISFATVDSDGKNVNYRYNADDSGVYSNYRNMNEYWTEENPRHCSASIADFAESDAITRWFMEDENIAKLAVDVDGNYIKTADGKIQVVPVAPGETYLYALVGGGEDGKFIRDEATGKFAVNSDGTVMRSFETIPNAKWDKVKITVGTKIDGTVFNDKQRDDIYSSEKDEVISGVKVTLLDKDGNQIAETTTDENGYYYFYVNPNSSYTLSLERPESYDATCAINTTVAGNKYAGKDSKVTCAVEIKDEINMTFNAGFYNAPSNPGGGGGSTTDPDPEEPTVDIPDPDVPLTEPDVPEEPTIDIDEPEVPLTDVPGEEVELGEPEVPLGDAPKTGDVAPVVGLVGLMAAAVIGLAITRRKLN